MRIAIVGAGISGLSCAYFLHGSHDITVFEAEDRIGGHTHTIDIAARESSVAVDTGWVRNIDRNRQAMLPILAKIYGTNAADVRLRRWRLLFLAGAEMFGYRGGEEWFVGHCLLERSTIPCTSDLQTAITA